MSTQFLDAKQIVTELGLYGSIFAVHRAVKRGEIPPGRLYGKRMLWNREALIAHTQEPPSPKKPRRVVMRR